MIKLIIALTIVALISSCKKIDTNDSKDVLFISDSTNVFGIKQSNLDTIYSNQHYQLNINETIIFSRIYHTNVNNFRISIFVNGIESSLNNDYSFIIK